MLWYDIKEETMGKHMPDENDIHGINFCVQKMFTHQVQFSSTIFLLSLYFAELLRRYFSKE